MSVPAWKQAILDRKKKAEEDAKKKEDDEASYLASLPPWKRAMVKKQRSPGSTLERKDSKGKSSITSASPSDPSNKWRAAVQNVKQEVSSSPKLSSRPSWAKHVPSSTPETSKEPVPSSTSSYKPMARPVTNSFSGALSAFTGKKTSQTSSAKPTSTGRPERSSKVNNTSSPVNQRAREPVSTTDTTTDSPSPVISRGISLRSKETQSAAIVSDKRRSFEGDDDEDAKLAAMPAWKKALILKRRAAASQPNKEPWAPVQSTRDKAASVPQNRLQTVKDAASVFQKQSKKEPEKNNRERAKSQPSVNTYSPPAVPTTNTEHEETEEIDYPHEPTIEKERYVDPTPVKPSAVKSTRPAPKAKDNRASQKSTTHKEAKPKTARAASKSPSAKPITTKKAPSQPERSSKSRSRPEIVNRPKPDNDVSNKLVEQEGSVHRPPVYKVVDEWADVSETDPRFKKLPLWKQALIKRRRSDYAKRSAAPPPPVSKDKKKSGTRDTDSKNTSQNQPLPNKAPSSSQNIFQPVRKAPPRPTPTPPSPPPEDEPDGPEPMFTFSFSKKGSKHRTLDAGSESEDSDSDLEDVTVTNLDDLSDEDSGIDKGGIVVTSYKVTSTEYGEPDDANQMQAPPTIQEPIGGMTKTDSKSILVDPAHRTKVYTCMHLLS